MWHFHAQVANLAYGKISRWLFFWEDVFPISMFVTCLLLEVLLNVPDCLSVLTLLLARPPVNLEQLVSATNWKAIGLITRLQESDKNCVLAPIYVVLKPPSFTVCNKHIFTSRIFLILEQLLLSFRTNNNVHLHTHRVVLHPECRH